jgi:AraC family transcriptional regulator
MDGYTRNVQPLANQWRSFAWQTGTFDTARRSYTEIVSGTIKVPHHLVLVTIRGGAKRLEVSSSCGHRYQGSDRAGSVSFVPAGCERNLELHGVASEWVSLGLYSDAFEAVSLNSTIKPFTNQEDPFLFGLAHELERLHTLDGGLEPLYCEAMTQTLAHYLARRYTTSFQKPKCFKLSTKQLQQVSDYVETNLTTSCRIADLAAILELSEGHFYRAFRATTQQTPLAFIHEKRIHKAVQLMTTHGELSVLEIALNVGFLSPSHFSRVFRKVMGVNPSQYEA